MARTYREAGVDDAEAARAIERIARAASATNTAAVLGAIGGFGGLFRLDPSTYPDPVLVSSTDNVGSKLKIAIALARHDTVGIDLVNQSVNDVVVTGADPLFFLDYLAVGRLRAEMAEEIVGGVARACAAAGIALIGGETAQLPDLFAADDDYDLSGFIVGICAQADLVNGSSVTPGDVLIGLPSSGLHTNGYTLARRVLDPETWSQPMPDGTRSIADALLEPHRSYLDEVRLMRRALRGVRTDIRAMAHITGGGWEGNVPRTLPAGLGVEVETGSWPVPPIFTLIQSRGDIADEEMVRTFNVGIGLTMVVAADAVQIALGAVPEALRIGTVVEVPAGAPRVRFG
ncbi:MAG: phosphoribosylformylglycinamidine cyclo-ligase [Chloroflexi bacterium]|nr:phosphoribosylformylglycinamidine cyclo-ligase [Chloroflexota bacterium]